MSSDPADTRSIDEVVCGPSNFADTSFLIVGFDSRDPRHGKPRF